MVGHEIELTWWQRLADLFYDFSAVIISIVDVVTDILITIQFAVNERWAFFWVAVTIFGLAQFCYSGLFTISYAESLRTKFQMLVFVCVFPFAQAVPAFMWLDSYNLPITKSILKFCKLDTNAFGEKECPPDKDELQFWIEQKFRSHGGFVIEAVIEAFPQSILQMISLVMFYNVDPLNVFSIVLSMTSVASKTLMFCYSIDRVTFFFNFLCMSADIFGVFCTLSWVFYHPGYTGEIRVLGWVWIWKIIVVSIACVVGGIFMVLTMFLLEISHDCIHNQNQFRITWREIRECFRELGRACFRCWKKIFEYIISTETWKDIFSSMDEECCSCPTAWENFKKFLETFAIFIAGSIYACMFPIAGVFLYCVAMMVLEIVKLSLLPLIFRNIDDKHRSNVRFYKPVFGWLLNAENEKDYHLRLAVANAYCCEDYLENVATSNKKGTWKSNKFMSWLLEPADKKEREAMKKLREEREAKEREEKEKKKRKKKRKKRKKMRIKRMMKKRIMKMMQIKKIKKIRKIKKARMKKPARKNKS